jgi:hypothetical protein
MPGAPRTPLSVFALVTLVAVGICATAAAVMVPALLGSLGSWPVLVAGLLLSGASLVKLWVIQRRRDHTLW